MQILTLVVWFDPHLAQRSGRAVAMAASEASR